MAASAAQGDSDQKDAKAGGHALAAAKPKPYREHVAEHGKEGSQGLSVAVSGLTSAGRRVEAAQAPSHTAAQPLSMSRRKVSGAQAFAAGAQHVGCANVAAAHGADVLMAEEAHQQVSGGDRPEQIRGGRDNEAGKGHDE